MNCLSCEYANIYNNTCEIYKIQLFYQGEQVSRKCDKYVEAQGNYNEERGENT